MIKQITIPGVPRQELNYLEDILAAWLKQTHRFEHSGIAQDETGPEYPFAEVDLKYGIKHFFHTTPAVEVEARGQCREGAFSVTMSINLPDDLYEKITACLNRAPTILASLGQSYAGK